MKFDLTILPPLMNAAGSLGFAPDPHGPVDLARLGAFITNPVSMERRTPAAGPRCAEFPGGFLIHTGNPNPGAHAVLRRYAPQWRRADLPVIVHLLVNRSDEAARLTRRFEGMPGVTGVEVGLPVNVSRQEAAAILQAASGELPVLARLPVDRAVELAEAVTASGVVVSAFSLGPPRGALPVGSTLVRGRMYGPGLFPQALLAVQNLASAGFAVIGAGGVYRREQAEAMLTSGAVAIQLDTVLWRGGFFQN